MLQSYLTWIFRMRTIMACRSISKHTQGTGQCKPSRTTPYNDNITLLWMRLR